MQEKTNKELNYPDICKSTWKVL